METQVNTISTNGEKIYLGIDAHKTNWKVTVLGEYISYKTFSQDPNPDTLYKYLNKHFPGAEYYSAYEAGFCGFWIHDRLEELGIKSLVVNPADVPTTDKEKRQKEDKRDSRKIARSLRAGELKAIRIPSKKNRQDRLLLRTRKNIQKDLQRNKNRIKGLLYFMGIDYPERFYQSNTHWSNAFMQWLESIQMVESSGQAALQALIDNSRYLRQQLLDITRKIRVLSQSETYKTNVKLLCSIPGIGMLTAMTLLTELERIVLYQKLDQLCGYIGFIPSTNSSSDKQRIGDITPRGKKHLRSMLIESAWIAVRNDPALRKKYNELCGRMKSNKAIIRIAKKLTNRIRYVLLNQKEYRILTYDKT
jgi:transposase